VICVAGSSIGGGVALAFAEVTYAALVDSLNVTARYMEMPPQNDSTKLLVEWHVACANLLSEGFCYES